METLGAVALYGAVAAVFVFAAIRLERSIKAAPPLTVSQRLERIGLKFLYGCFVFWLLYRFLWWYFGHAPFELWLITLFSAALVAYSELTDGAEQKGNRRRSD